MNYKNGSKNELKEIDINNCVCYYLHDIINGTDISFSNILLDKKWYENILVYEICTKFQRTQKQCL